MYTTNAIDDFFGPSLVHVLRARANVIPIHPSSVIAYHPLMQTPGSLLTWQSPIPSLSRSQCISSNSDSVRITISPSVAFKCLILILLSLLAVFPPLWVLGATMLMSPLTAPADLEPSKSGTERQQLVQMIRDTELRWARCCAWALVALLVLAGVVALTSLAVLYS